MKNFKVKFGLKNLGEYNVLYKMEKEFSTATEALDFCFHRACALYEKYCSKVGKRNVEDFFIDDELNGTEIAELLFDDEREEFLCYEIEK